MGHSWTTTALNRAAWLAGALQFVQKTCQKLKLRFTRAQCQRWHAVQNERLTTRDAEFGSRA
eukprot:2597182-Amphidinium_carterae.1